MDVMVRVFRDGTGERLPYFGDLVSHGVAPYLVGESLASQYPHRGRQRLAAFFLNKEQLDVIIGPELWFADDYTWDELHAESHRRLPALRSEQLLGSGRMTIAYGTGDATVMLEVTRFQPPAPSLTQSEVIAALRRHFGYPVVLAVEQ